MISSLYFLGVFLFFVIEIQKDVHAERRYRNEHQKKTDKPEILAVRRGVFRKYRRQYKRDHDRGKVDNDHRCRL